jgi:HNH endonuclease
MKCYYCGEDTNTYVCDGCYDTWSSNWRGTCRNQYETEVSDEDYQWLLQWRWNFKKNKPNRGGNIYARRSTTNGTAFYMASEILEKRIGRSRPSSKHEAEHKNRDSLDNRRENLDWATKSQQSKNRVYRHIFGRKLKKPIVPVQVPALSEDIPF